VQSMTGFAELAGGDGTLAWRWEARSVNGRGLDLRLRLPDGCEALEPVVRAGFAARFARGNVTVGLRIAREAAAAVSGPDAASLELALAVISRTEAAARAAGIALQPVSADRVLAMPGVLGGAEAGPVLDEARFARLAGEVGALAQRLVTARTSEGATLAATLAGHLDQIRPLIAEARHTAEARSARSGALLRERVAALLGAGAPPDEARLAQELAQIAVKSDVTEELDRLAAHVDAASALIDAGEPAGRKLDFLAQEFNREANTLCSNAGSIDLTRTGLALKVVIDQFREQVQNVE
jgi:uncharacterized protein (TIGR00255 family)